MLLDNSKNRSFEARINRAFAQWEGVLGVVIWHFVAGVLLALTATGIVALGGCSAPPVPPLEPVDAGTDSGGTCTVFEPWPHAGEPCDALAPVPCPDTNNPCMISYCTNDSVCVLADRGAGQPGVCPGDQWCNYVSPGVLGCCIEPPPCIYDGNNCLLTGCSLASHPWCSPDGECCQ